tara:strand:- start:1819 stop:3777 length:1959 start_codon:yes stop_codon:yes gene_type:complete
MTKAFDSLGKKNGIQSQDTSTAENISQTLHQFIDNRPETVLQRMLHYLANKSKSARLPIQKKSAAEEEEVLQGKFEPIQKQENKTGLPNNLKSGIENLSGYSMDYVKVHYNSNQPAQLNAHAYAQGTDIHLAPGQEKHLPHEAWHVVQQKQGRVKPTLQMKGKTNVNDDVGLDKEADVMGAQAYNLIQKQKEVLNKLSVHNMNIKQDSSNAPTITRELDWFQQLLLLRGKITFEQSEPEAAMDVLLPPSLENENSHYSQLIKKHQMGMEERLVLILALIPHIKPSLLDILNMKNELYDMPFTEFGGIRDNKHKGYLPTGETAAFLLAGSDLEKRFALLPLFEKDHFFYKEGILTLESSSSNEPLLYGLLRISPEYLPLLTTGKVFKPDFSPYFQAKRITTSQEWDDLVVADHLLNGLEEIKAYTQYGKQLKNDYQFGKKIKPGFKVLFTGPPGTGKTLAATLLGKASNMDVYRIDLSMVVSKYIGEIEKNLLSVFDLAENKDWILFFDEADALFGKRDNTLDSDVRYDNQLVSFLLQRMEDFNGLVILCSNFKKNFDKAFFRRFQLVLDFEIPDAHQRYVLWQKSKTQEFEYEAAIDLDSLAEDYELTAASIINILHYSILKCLGRNDTLIQLKDIEAGLKIEKIKEGKSIY